MRDLKEYLECDCEHFLLKCSNRSCKLMLPKRERNAHSTECPYGDLACDLCGNMISFEDKDAHLQCCTHRFLVCEYCGLRDILSKNMKYHLEFCITYLQKQLRKQRDYNEDLKALWKSRIYSWSEVTCVIDIDSFERISYSSPFFSKQRGHKLRLRLMPRSVDDGRSSTVGLFVHVMKGPYDDLVSWPLECIVNLCIIDQETFAKECRHSLEINGSLRMAQRTYLDGATTGFGYEIFCTRTEMSRYSKNDVLLVHVKTVF